jgi:hypothetical protein
MEVEDLERFGRMKRRLLLGSMSWLVHRQHGRGRGVQMLSMPTRQLNFSPRHSSPHAGHVKLTDKGLYSLTHPIAIPTTVNKIT